MLLNLITLLDKILLLVIILFFLHQNDLSDTFLKSHPQTIQFSHMKLSDAKTSELIAKSTQAKKESKRTTFKLSDQSIKAIDWITETFNFTAKEVFDLISDKNEFFEAGIKFSSEHDDSDFNEQTRKSFVISKQALSILNQTSENHKVSRDMLVEKLILTYKALMEKLLKKERENEEKVLEIVSEFWSEAEKVQSRLSELLSDGNPIISRFGMITVIIESLYSAIDSKISNGTPVDPEDISQQS